MGTQAIDALVSARVMLASDHAESARQLLAQVGQETRGHGFVGVELEDRFAMAKLARETGHVAAAQEQLIDLEKAARAKGFGLIASKAKTVRDNGGKPATL